MVIDNRNYKILHDKCLEYEDYVYFNYKQKRYDYQVESSFLNNLQRISNGAIFNALDLNKHDIATGIYGYESNKGDWPCSKNEDYEALTRLVIFLFEEIEKRENPKAFTQSILSNSIKIKINIEPQIKIELK